MYKLAIRLNPISIAALLIFAGACIVLPKQEILAGGFQLNTALVFIIPILVSLIGSTFLFAPASRLQKYQIWLTMLALSLFFGALGNFFYSFWVFDKSFMNVDFSIAQIVLMNIGGVLTALSLYKLEPFDAFSEVTKGRLQRSRVQLEEEPPAALPPMQPDMFEGAESAADFMKGRATSNKLRGMTVSKTDISAARSSKTGMDAAKASASGLDALRPNVSKTGMNAVQNPAAEELGAPTGLNQASISKTGMDAAPSTFANSSSLTPQSPSPQAFSAPQTEPRPHQLSAPPMVDIDLEASDEMLSGPLNPSPNPQSPSGTSDKPSVTGNRLQAQRRRNTSTFTKLQALSASGTGSSHAPERANEGSDLRSILDRLDADGAPPSLEFDKPKVPGDAPKTGLGGAFGKKAESPDSGAPRLANLLDRAESMSAAQAPAPTPAPTPTPTPAVKPPSPAPAPAQRPPAPAAPSGLASTPTNANKPGIPPAPKPAPQAPPATVNDSMSSLLSKRFLEMADDDEVPAAQTPPSTSNAEHSNLIGTDSDTGLSSLGTDSGVGFQELRGHLFESGVDNAIDDIFTGLAPETAQQAVSHDSHDTSDLVSPRTSQSPNLFNAPQEEANDNLFGQDIGSEIDDIFSNMAPQQAQQGVEVHTREDRARALQDEPTPGEDSEPLLQLNDADMDNIFAGLAPQDEQFTPGPQDAEEPLLQVSDSDMDDIFSGLAPADAQKSVDVIPSTGQVQNVSLSDLKAQIQKHNDVSTSATNANVLSPLEEAGDSPLLNVSDSEMDSIFGGLMAEPEESPGAQADEKPLLNLGDSDMDDIFSGLTEQPATAGNAANTSVSALASPKTPKQTGEMPALNPNQIAALREQVKQPGKLSDTMNRIPALKDHVDGLLTQPEKEKPKSDAEEVLTSEQQAARKASENLKDFGKLSVRSAQAPKVQGETAGTMKTIGKLLIDQQSIEAIINAGESRQLGKGLPSARIISKARGAGINELLNKIGEYQGVAGSLIVGHDGLVMSSTLQQGWDKDMLGALSTALLSTSNLSTKKLEIGRLRQMVLLTRTPNADKTTILTDVDVGILVVFCEQTDITLIDGLIDKIQNTING
ncbi:hypothetical protein KA183_05315 [bacterium]|nr:hypothetical protein [bacterium]